MRTVLESRERSWSTVLAVSVAYVLAYVFLDRVSFIHDLQHTEISPWGPQIALICAMVMYFGPRAAPLTVVTPGISEIVLRHAPASGLTVIGAMACIGVVYTVAGLVLRRLQRAYTQPTVGWFAFLLAVIVASTFLDAALYSAVLIHSGDLSAGSYLEALRIDWVGDVNGVIILLPLMLILRVGEPGKVREMSAGLWQLALQSAALLCAFWVAFHDTWAGEGDGGTQTRFYVLFLPIIWIALRWGAGVTAVALVILQAGIVAFVAKYNTPESFRAIQLLMVLLAATGLFMGISKSEKARYGALMRSKDDELSRLSARMAVSEMNSAIGHELNNPLAALVNYLRSATLILDMPGFDRAQLQSALDKAHGEATRSVNVVRKLREFFRSGVVRRQSVDPKKLAGEVLEAMQGRFREAGVVAVSRIQTELPLLTVDALQLSMVLQNLLANAYDAVQDVSWRGGSVTLAVTRSADHVVFSVEDGGSGIPDALRDQLFRPVSSTKLKGMGLGLAICRSLVEANQGSIWLDRSDSNGTCISFSIPANLNETDEVQA